MTKAAYNEKYNRNQDMIDERLRGKYAADMQDAQSKMPKMTETLRGKEMSLDSRMNKLVWGGKANLNTTTNDTTPKQQQSSSSSSNDDVGGPADDWESEDDYDSSYDSSSSSSSSSTSSSSSSDDEYSDADDDERKSIRKKRRKRKGEKKKRRKKKNGINKNQKTETEKTVEALMEEKEKKLIIQSMAAGVTLGALAMAATFLVGGSRRN